MTTYSRNACPANTSAEPRLDFRTEASSFVAQLHKRPGVVDADTVHLFNATKPTGNTFVTVPRGSFYLDVDSADHSYVVRLGPKR